MSFLYLFIFSLAINLILCVLDPPSGMSQPTVENVTDDSVTLSWEPPRKGPITGYTIEKRGKGDRAWTK